MPRVVVVTAAKNAAAYLPATLASIGEQTFSDWEHVVVDDGSTDETAAVVEAAAERDSRVKLLRLPESVGAYAAANVAMLQADSDFLARVDADDLARPNRLRLQVDALDDQPTAAANVGAWQPISQDGAVSDRVYYVPTRRNGVMKWMLWLRGGPLHSTLLIRTKYFQEIGGYGPERIAEDYRLWCRLARDAGMSVLHRTLALYRYHDEQITATPGTFDAPARLRTRLEHMQLCSPSDWTEQDALDFRNIGSWSAAGVSAARALELMGRWESAWRTDPSLDEGDIEELRTRSATTLVAHLGRSAKRRSRGTVGAALRAAPRLTAAFIRVQRHGYTPWSSD